MNNYAHIINYIMQVISRYLICDETAASAFGILAMTVITIVIASKCTPYATATRREMNPFSRLDVLRDAPREP